MIGNKKILVPLVISLIASYSCGLFRTRAGGAETVSAATEVGTPQGDKMTRSIGSAGGSLASADGRLTLTVPQNALTETIPFSIESITNKAGGALGPAYRLEPSGKTFTTPLEISVRYNDRDLEGTSPEALAIGYQDAQHAWHLVNTARLDQSAKTLTIQATHFTDWSFLAKVRISPVQATVRVGQSVKMEITGCLPEESVPRITRFLQPLRHWCHVTDGQYNYGLKADWYTDVGTIDDHSSVQILYTAPSKKPTPNIATISYPFWVSGSEGGQRGMFAAHVTIVDRSYRASGHDGPTSYAGVICSLEQPFMLMGNNSLVPYPIKFFPTSATSGTLTYLATWKLLTMSGVGTYTIDGTDTDHPLIVAQTKSTLTAMGRTSTGGGPAHIDLTPLDANECGDQ